MGTHDGTSGTTRSGTARAATTTDTTSPTSTTPTSTTGTDATTPPPKTPTRTGPTTTTTARTPWRRAALAVAGLCCLPVLAGCASWGVEGGPGSRMSEAESATSANEATAEVGADGVQRVTLTVDDRQRFTPAVIRARTGPLVITVKDLGTTPHSLILPGGTTLGELSGGTQEVRLNFGKSGSYAFNCMYHVGGGMTGTIEIG